MKLFVDSIFTNKFWRANLLRFFIFFIVVVFNVNDICAQRFRASVVKVDITPKTSQFLAGYEARQSIGVHDHIFHRIVALDDGKSQFFLVSSDIGKYDISLYDEVVKKLYNLYGIDSKHIWWSVTHTHSAPEIGKPGLSETFMAERYNHPVAIEYTTFVVNKLIDGILEARKKLVPARLGIGWGWSLANISRRGIDENGKVRLGLNPDGDVDRRIGLIRIDKEDGKPLAVIANYPMHGTVLGSSNLMISGDAPGIVSEYVESKIGVPMLYINGAAGDLAPIYSVYPTPKDGHLNEFRVLLGDKILEAYRKISPSAKEVKLTVGELTVETPRKEGLNWPAYLNKYSNTLSNGRHLVRIPVRFLKINEDAAIWSAPLELYCGVAKEVRRYSPFAYTLFFGYSNGNLRYLPTEEAFKHGGYEPSGSPFTSSAAKDLTEAVLGYLNGELRSGY